MATKRRKQAPKIYTKSISNYEKGHENKGWNWQYIICVFVISTVVIITFCSALIGHFNPLEIFTQKSDSVKPGNANIKSGNKSFQIILISFNKLNFLMVLILFVFFLLDRNGNFNV